MAYKDLLLLPEWQRKRLEILQRDNFRCVFCTDSRSTLQVHHEAYMGNPWDISSDKLKTVCCHCHTVIHTIPKYTVQAINKNQSLISKCWECVAFTTTDIIFLYLFFANNAHTDKCEVITIFSNDSKNLSQDVRMDKAA